MHQSHGHAPRPEFGRTASGPGSAGANAPGGGRTISFSVNAQLFAQGSTASQAYRVQSGRVRLFRETGLKRAIVDEVGPGSLIGVGEVLAGLSYGVGAIAVEATVVEVLPAQALQSALGGSEPIVQALILESARREQRLLQLAESPSVEQSFLGLCKGLELLMPVGSGPQPESQVVARLRELFGLPTPVVRTALRIMSDLNLVRRAQQGPMEATLFVGEPRLMERAREVVDRWLTTLPAMLTRDAPREPWSVEELAADLGIEPQALLRRTMAADFPTATLRFDGEGVANIRAIYGDAFFKKKTTSKDLLSEAQSIDELTGVDVSVLREFVPQMDLNRLCQLLTRAEEKVREHMLSALTPRMRRVAQAEIAAMSPISEALFADIESEVMTLARTSMGAK